MLQDRRESQERWAFRRRERRRLPEAFGDFIAGLDRWSWFVTVTFQDKNPVPDAVMARLKEWLADIEKMAGSPIGWVIAEEFGSLGGRFHCHLLVSGVSHLPRDFWWREAFRRFGRNRIEPFDPSRGAAFYAAKYASKSLGAIHFGGALGDRDLSDMNTSDGDFKLVGEAVGRQEKPTFGCEVVQSAEVPKIFYRLSLPRWHR